MFGRISSDTDRMIRLFNEEMGGAYITSSDVTDPGGMRKALVATVQTGVTKTMTIATRTLHPITGSDSGTGVSTRSSGRAVRCEPGLGLSYLWLWEF